MILNKGFVEVIEYMGSDLKVVNAARVSMGKRKKELDASDEKLIQYLIKNKHTSPFRHCLVTFHVKAPEYVARQWYKHVVGCEYSSDQSFKDTGWNEISGRYTQYTEYDIPEFRKYTKNIKQGSIDEIHTQNEELKEQYKEIADMVYTFYNNLIEQGVPPEQARTILPMSLYTEWYWTASLQAIVHFVNLRNEEHAQKEMRVYANEINIIMSKLFPISWRYLC